MSLIPLGRHRSRRGIPAGIAILSALALTLVGCSAPSGSGNSASAGSTLTVVTADNNMGWAVDHSVTGFEQQINVQATLLKKPYVATEQAGVQIQNMAEFQPYLAESLDVSRDGLVYTFHLKDVVSAQGNVLSSEDVRWSFERKFKTPTAISYPIASPVWYDPAKQIKVIDDKTISFTLANAGHGATFKALMSDLFGHIYDATYLKANATPDDPYAVKFSATNPNHGFGPYKVTTWDASTGATLEALPDYLPGEPAVKKVVVRVVPDSGSRVNAVTSGSADIAENVDPAASADAKSNPNVIVPEVKNTNEFVMMPLVTSKAPFNNQLVRQAMAHAVPYDKIISNVFHGLAVRDGSGFLDTTAPGYTGAGLPDYSFDPAKAKQLLAQAGVPTPVKFAITVSASDSDMVNTAIQIQSAAAEAGFEIAIDKVNQSQFNEQKAKHTAQAFVLRDWAITMTPGYELLVHTAPKSSNNLADWEYQPYYDAVAKGYSHADAFSPEAGAQWNAAEQILIKASPIVYIGRTQPSVLLSKKVDGFAKRSGPYIDYSNLSVSR
jgi:peptide/nickel transport system substrate-binding protein